MPSIIEDINNFPDRYSLLDIDPELEDFNETILFHPFDISDLQKNNKIKIYNRNLKNYSIIITGVLDKGIRANLIIDNIPIYVDVRLSEKYDIDQDEYESFEISNIIKLIYDNPLASRNKTKNIVWKYPCIGFVVNPIPYLRLYFNNTWHRKDAIKKLKSKKYETANDIEGCLLNHYIINYDWSIGDWGTIENYSLEFNKDKRLYNIFISRPEDFKAVNTPLTTNPPRCKTPKQPIYFHIPYDIEVNSTTTSMPNVNNMEEKIFMLSGGVYCSNNPNNPLVSFTITHCQCMREEYKRYMSSERRAKFMNDDRPDWILIITESEEESLMVYAEILNKIQPEFRSQFNGYNFDDPYVCTRIKLHNKYDEFYDKISIVPLNYYCYIKESNPEEDKFEKTLKKTHIKLEAGVFDNTENKRRLFYLGSLNVDIMTAMKKANPKDDLLVGHALRAYLERYGLPKKIDMDISDMNNYYYENNALGLLEVADYCVVDALSCHRIADKIGLFESYLALSHISLCSPSDSLFRAGGMKVKNIIYCFGNRMDISYTENTKPESIPGKFPGAKVFPPVRGRYTEVPTIALDFSSLYPSIMRAVWTSSETYTDNPKQIQRLKNKGYNVFEFNPKWDTEYKNSKDETIKTTIDKKVAFVREDPEGKPIRGVYPKCLEFLTNARKQYKKSMAKAMDKVAKLQKEIDQKGTSLELERDLFEAMLEEKSFNQKQLAVKIISNTIYGKTGSATFNLYNPFIASTITLMGQKLITAAADVSIEKGYKLLYGDSFTGNTPVIIKQNNEIRITRVDEIIEEDKWETRIDGKEYYDFDGLEIWEKDKFVKANQLIRHRTNKEIVRVQTHCGLADVTTDHSLYNSKGEKISPNDIVVTSGMKKDNTFVEGTELLTTSFDNLIQEFKDNEKDFGITEDLAWCYGFWMAEGYAGRSCNKYNTNSGVKYYKDYRWDVTNADPEMIKKFRDKIGFETKIHVSHSTKNYNVKRDVYKIVSNVGRKELSIKYRRLFYNNHGEKQVLIEILYSSEKIANAFLDGFYEGDGDVKSRNRRDNKYYFISQKGQHTCLGLIILIHKCRYYKININTVSGNTTSVFSLTYHNNTMKKKADVVKKKYTLHKEYNDFVYDFNTETGKHHAGIGNIVLSNTDSVFLIPTVDMMKGETVPAEKVKICNNLAETDLLPDIHVKMREITQRKTDVIKMELDKLLYPGLFVGKKRYIGTIYEGDKKPHDYISGMEFVKRGKSNLLIDLSKRIVQLVLDLNNNTEVIDMVLEVFKEGIKQVQNEPLEYFVKKAKYRTGKEGFLTQFMDRMKQKNKLKPTLYELPSPNAVFEYIVVSQISDHYCDGKMKKLKISEKMEFKNIVEKSNGKLKPDYSYYIDDVIGALARFICSHNDFNEDLSNEIDFETIDKKSNENAKKFLKEKLDEFMGIEKVHHTIIKKQCKYIVSQYSYQYGDLLSIYNKAYNESISSKEIYSFILNHCEDVSPIESEEENIEELLVKKKEILEYLYEKKYKITMVYTRYVEDLIQASSKEIEDISTFDKSDHISKRTNKIYSCIENLIYINSILMSQGKRDQVVVLVDPSVKALKKESITALLLRILEE